MLRSDGGYILPWVGGGVERSGSLTVWFLLSWRPDGTHALPQMPVTPTHFTFSLCWVYIPWNQRLLSEIHTTVLTLGRLNKGGSSHLWGDPKEQCSPGGSEVKNPPAKQETRVWSRVRKIPWSRKWPVTPVFLPGKFHGGHKGSDTTEQLSTLTQTSAFVLQECPPSQFLRSLRRLHPHLHTGQFLPSTAGL